MLFSAVLVIGLATVSANGEQAQEVVLQTNAAAHTNAAPQTNATAPQSEPDLSPRQELLRQIAAYEVTVRNAEADHVGNERLVKFYLRLAGLYEYAAMYAQSESALHQAIALLQAGPKDELAMAISHLAGMHMAMGELHKSEGDLAEALRLRESIGDPVGIAEVWNDLAGIYVRERRYKPALVYAKRAMAVLGDDTKVDPEQRISVRQTLARVLCESHDWGHASMLLKDALELAKSSYGDDSPSVGFGYFILGYEASLGGDLEEAGEWMHEGTSRMKVDLGPDHPVYVDSMKEYAQFLHKRGQVEAAAVVDREVRQAEAVVDVRTLASRSGNALVASPR